MVACKLELFKSRKRVSGTDESWSAGVAASHAEAGGHPSAL